MMYRIVTTILVFSSLFLFSCTSAQKHKTDEKSELQPSGTWTGFISGAAKTPPMGWNSWNAFRTDVDEEKVLGSAQAIVDRGLATLGYQYINIDDGWWLKRREQDDRIMIRTSLFPSTAVDDERHSSFKSYVSHLHSMGLKAGIYTDIGQNACSQAWDLDSPNLPTGSTFERQVGLYGHVEQDLNLFFQEWGFDYIKVDACGLSDFGASNPSVKLHDYQAFVPLIVRGNINRSDVQRVTNLYTNISNVLKNINPDNDFVLSICNWGEVNVRAWGKNVGNLWRTSGDINPTWSRMLQVFDSVATRALYAGPGTWNDPDSLYIGHGDFDERHLTEAKSHFALWAIVAAPLLIGYDLREAPQSLYDIWSAEEIIAVNQDPEGHQGVLVYASDDMQIFVKTLKTKGEKAVVIFNRGINTLDAQLTAAHLNMQDTKPISLRDLWKRQELGKFLRETTFTLAPREALILKAVGEPELVDGVYLSEIPGRINVAEDGVIAPQMDQTVYKMIGGSGTRNGGQRPQYAGWGGPRVNATPYGESIRFKNVTYRNGIGILANSRLEVKAQKQFTQFTAQVAIDDSSLGKNSQVYFEVYGDGKLLSTTSAMNYESDSVYIKADISGVVVMELIVRQLRQGTAPVIVAWANAQLN